MGGRFRTTGKPAARASIRRHWRAPYGTQMAQLGGGLFRKGMIETGTTDQRGSGARFLRVVRVADGLAQARL